MDAKEFIKTIGWDEKSQGHFDFNGLAQVIKQYQNTISKEFEYASKPLMKYLAENHHPHTKVIVESNSSQLLEGLKSIVTDEFIVD